MTDRYCPHGHLMSPENVSRETRPNGYVSLRCKVCNRNRKRLRYHTDPTYRKVYQAYSHWYRCGHPEGRTWPEIRDQILKETNDAGIRNELPGWVRGTRGPSPQLHLRNPMESIDWQTMQSKIISIVELPEHERELDLDTVAKAHPCPEAAA